MRSTRREGEGKSATESPEKTCGAKAQAMFYKPFAAARGDTSRTEPSWRTIQITSCAKSRCGVGALRKTEAALKFVLEGEGRANEGWTVFPEHLKLTCTDFDPLLLDALVKDG